MGHEIAKECTQNMGLELRKNLKDLTMENEPTSIQVIQAAGTDLTTDEVSFLSRELKNVRDDVRDCPYLNEALRVLRVQGYRSAIGAYWNAVVDDLRQKIMHRSIDLFNKEVKPKKPIERYEDFQDYLTDFELIEGAYKIGVLSWEARKMLHQARETRNLFDGHPKSSDPGLLKVLNLVSDCNKYVLSEEFPPAIIDINAYLGLMDSSSFLRNEMMVDQAFGDLPSIYKTELANRFFSAYTGENISSELRGNIEFCAPILWKAIGKDDKKQIGMRFDKLMVEGNGQKIERGVTFTRLVSGLMYVSVASRRVLIEPLIDELSSSLDDWSNEERLVKEIKPFSSFIPVEIAQKFVAAITKTYVGYRGGSPQWSRTTFYSNGAATPVKEMFESFDSALTDLFVEMIRSDLMLRRRIKGRGQLGRLRVLAEILKENGLGKDDSKLFLELLCDETRTDEFYAQLGPIE